MIPLSEILKSTAGAWGLLHRRPEAVNQFNLSLEGFWRSFQIHILLAPLHFGILIMLGQSLDPELTGGKGTTFLGAAVIYTAHLASFPILMIFLARHLQLAHNYVPYIIVQNWAGVVEFLIYSVIVVLIYAGLFSSTTFAFAGLILMILFVMYEWYVTTQVLEASSFVAAGLVVVKTLLTLVLQEGLGRFFVA